jgi:hypothetical protein
MAYYRSVSQPHITKELDWTKAEKVQDESGELWLLIYPQLPAMSEQIGGSHYKDYRIQPVQFFHDNNVPFIEASVCKYVLRWRNKNGIEDLKKARHYLDMLIEMEERK